MKQVAGPRWVMMLVFSVLLLDLTTSPMRSYTGA